jgi:hypothetical protein
LVAALPHESVSSDRVTLSLRVRAALDAPRLPWSSSGFERTPKPFAFGPCTAVIPNPGLTGKESWRGFARLTAVDKMESVARINPAEGQSEPCHLVAREPSEQGALPLEAQGLIPAQMSLSQEPFCLPGAPFAATNRLPDTISC